MNTRWRRTIVAATLLIGGAMATDAVAADFRVNAPGVLKDNFGQGAPDYSSYAPDIKFPIAGFPSTLNSQVRNKGGQVGGDQCDAGNYNDVWSDTLCETRGRKEFPPLGCPLDTVHQGVDIRGGTVQTCNTLRNGRQNIVPIVAVKDGVIKQIGSYTVDLWPRDGERYRYLHMNMRDLKVKLNDRVSAGDTIGFMYNDFGGTPTTFHLHFEHWKNIAGKGFVPVPVYCDLVAAYERDRAMTAVMVGGGQRCQASSVALAGGGPGVVTEAAPASGISSYWTHSGSEVGLLAAGNTREFVVATPRQDVASAVLPGDRIFSGVKDGERYRGKARVLGDACGNGEFDVAGPVLENGKRVELVGNRVRAGIGCPNVGAEQVTLVFKFVRRSGEGQAGPAAACADVVLDRRFKTELTRNWGALTMYTPWENWHAYIKNWPGLRRGPDGRPVDVQTDSFGGTIMAFETDEAGVGIWWYWLLVRKGYGANGVATSKPTLAEIARGIAGATAPATAIDNYVNAYTRLSQQYFGHQLGKDDAIAITDADELWALGQTMFHHESSRTPLIDRATFDRGIKLGSDFMQGRFQGLKAYQRSCTESSPVVAVAGAGADDIADRDERILALEQTNARLNGMIKELQDRLDKISKLAAE